MNFEGLNLNFYCPITGELMKDPVIDRDGITYERQAIESWIRLNGTSPTTRAPMSISELTPNRSLRDAIQEETKKCESNPITHATDYQLPDFPPEWVQSIIPEIKISKTIVNSDYRNKIIKFNPVEYDEYFINISVTTPDLVIEDHVPSDLVLIIDISGSMNNNAVPPGSETASINITLLDLVKHATKTIIETLASYDRLALISFSNQAEIVLDFTFMTPVGKHLAKTCLGNMQADGMTNIWDGLYTGLEMLETRYSSASFQFRNSAIFLLTDGEPNINPPRGIIPMLERYKEKHNGKMSGVINTFGFGYSLDSTLLRYISNIGNGMYAFIPDSGFVGTTFVNALANTLTTVIPSSELVINASSDIRITPLSTILSNSIPTNLGRPNENTIRSPIGIVRMGQSVDTVFHILVPKLYSSSIPLLDIKIQSEWTGENVSETRKYSSITIQSLHDITSSQLEQDNIEYQIVRTKAVYVLQQMFEAMISSENLIDPTTILQDFISYIDRVLFTSLLSEKYIKAIRADFSGQVTEAISKPAWFNRWGRHYLPSLQRAHELQQCSNFKDPGIQDYGGRKFRDVRDYADDIFCAMPPPEPTKPPAYVMAQYALSGPHTPTGYGNISPSASFLFAAANSSPRGNVMASFNNRDAACIHGDCSVLLADYSYKSIKYLKCGDCVITDSGVGMIRCVIASQIQSGVCDFVHFPNGLIITPWHPVLVNERWTFPNDIFTPQRTKCDKVYSFLIERLKPEYVSDSQSSNIIQLQSTVEMDKHYSASLQVNGIFCAALAHEITNDDVMNHALYGSLGIVKYLSLCAGWEEGFILFGSDWLIRDKDSGLVCQIDISKEILLE